MPRGKPTKMKECAICRELFLPEKPSSRICSKNHYADCPICGKQMLWNTTRKVEPCSRGCRKEATRRMYVEKYGVDHPMKCKQVQENHKKAMLDKYGVEHPLQSDTIKDKIKESNRQKFGTDWALSNQEVRSKIEQTNLDRYGSTSPLGNKDIQEKSKQTCLDKYGVEYANQSEEVKDKIKESLLDRFGVDNAMKCPEVANKVSEYRKAHKEEILANIRQSFVEKYGVDNPMKVPELVDKIAQTMITRYGVKSAIQVPEFREKYIQTMLERYGVANPMQSPEIREKSIQRLNGGRISKINRKFGELLDENGIQYEYEKYISTNGMTRWYDIHILNTDILIEIDPTYTHNLIGNHWSDGIECGYHLEKTLLAIQNGYRVIHVFDWDDWDKIVDMLRDKENVYARKCKLFKISTSTANEFLDKYHLQGKCRGQLLCLGLYYNNELVQVMTFGKSRYDKKHDVELLRLCSHPKYRIVGGASKMFKFATEYYGLSNVISYCDVSKFTGEVYDAIGMKKVRTTPPQEVWSDGMSKITANLLRQQGFDRLFGTDFGKGTNNELLMIEHGWLPIEDCGQYVYEYIG